MHTADVKNVLRVYSIEVAAREKDDLNEDPIVTRLRKVRSCIIQVAGRSRPDCLAFLAFNNRLVGPAMTAFRIFKYRIHTMSMQSGCKLCIISHRRSSFIQFGVLDKCLLHTPRRFPGYLRWSLLNYGSAARKCLKELLEIVYALFLKPHAHPFGHGLRT